MCKRSYIQWCLFRTYFDLDIILEMQALTKEGVVCQGPASLGVIGVVCDIVCRFWWTTMVESVGADSDCFVGGE